MPEIFLALLLICAVLALLVLGPAHSPPFEELQEFTCDFSAMAPPIRWGRGSRSTYYATCRSDHQVAHFGALPIATNAVQWQKFRRGGGIVKIRRPALPSPYGGYIFQITCNNEVIVSYRDASAYYESRRTFVGLLACCLLALSGGVLGFRLLRMLRLPR
jgi:hypothetical protein